MSLELDGCPFCGGEVIEKHDADGGSWIEHIEAVKDGGVQRCILTDVQLNTSSRNLFGWNNRYGKEMLETEIACLRMREAELLKKKPQAGI